MGPNLGLPLIATKFFRLAILYTVILVNLKAEELHLDEPRPWPSEKPVLIRSPKKSEFKALRDTFLKDVMDYGNNEAQVLYNELEPLLYQKGLQIGHNDPAGYVAAFNRQAPIAKNMAWFGYSLLMASERLQKQLDLTKQQSQLLDLFSLKTRISGRLDCPVRASFRQDPCFSDDKFRTVDGMCNNLEHPDWGKSFRPFLRFLPAAYEDGIQSLRKSVTGQNLPSPRTVSTFIHASQSKLSSTVSLLLMQWGQFLDHDLTSTSQTRGFNGSVPRCCTPDGHGLNRTLQHPDCLPIAISHEDTFYSHYNRTCMEFVRSSPVPKEDCTLGAREQINQVTSYLDGSAVYGSTAETSDDLRMFQKGMLKYNSRSLRKSLLPVAPSLESAECIVESDNLGCFYAGDNRVNEQPGLASMHTLWLREHNRLVTELAQLNPHWDDERLYQEGRKIVIAEIQHITYKHWLPIILGPSVLRIFEIEVKDKGYYYGYNSTINPTTANAFAAAAFRFGHSLVSGQLNRCDRFHRTVPLSLKLRDELMNPSNLYNLGAVDRLMLGLASQQAETRDEFVDSELTNHLFQIPGHDFGMDLVALNIQRGRDHGLPSYNNWRERCSLKRHGSFGDLYNYMHSDTVQKLKSLYKHVDDVDLFTGGLSERPIVGGLVGPTFACIIAQQFSTLRKGDRYWYENGAERHSFTARQLKEIRKSSLSRVICDNLDDITDIQTNTFLMANPISNPYASCVSDGMIASLDLRPWQEDSGDNDDENLNTIQHEDEIPTPIFHILGRNPHPDIFFDSTEEEPTPLFQAGEIHEFEPTVNDIESILDNYLHSKISETI